MFLFKLPAYSYLFLWAVMAFLPYVYFSTKVYESLLFVFSILSLVYSLFAALNYRLPIYFKCMFFFVFILALYGGYEFFLGNDIYWQSAGRMVASKDYLLWLFVSMLTSVPVYVFTCKGMLQEKEMKIFFVVMFISCIYAFQIFSKAQMVEAAVKGLNDDEFTVTCVYSFISTLPFIVLFKKNVFLQFVIASTVFVFCILGVKRGPVLLTILCVLFFIWNTFKFASIKKKVLTIFFVFILSIGIYSLVLYQMENSPYFAFRVEQTLNGDTSDRDSYGLKILDFYLNSTNTTEFFLGIGANQTLNVNRSFAHNDWLGILVEQGLLGAFFYLLYWIAFLISWMKSKVHIDSYVALGMLALVGFGKSMFSMYYLPVTAEMIVSSGFFSMGLGFFLAKAYPQDSLVELKNDSI